MGLGIGFGRSSRSSYDQPCRVIERERVVIKEVPVNLPNPNPKNYKITFSLQIDRYLTIKVHYPDCVNYEGNKILIYRDCNMRALFDQGSVDPHFSDNKNFHSPIARFVPTDEGLKMALDFMALMVRNEAK